MKIDPKCLKFNSPDNKGAAYTSDGFLLPCCWLDDVPVYRYIKEAGLKDPELALENNDCLEDIFTSEQWEKFFQKLFDEPDKCSYMCKQKCGVEFTEQENLIRMAEEKMEVALSSGGKNY